MKMNNKEKTNYESDKSISPNIAAVIEIPLQITSDTQLEVLKKEELYKIIKNK